MMVYKHTAPNEKIYIGVAKDGLTRWADGIGYKDNIAFYSDISKYGWENIKTEILKDNLKEENALELEKNLIIAYDAENPDVGYNRTRHKATLLGLKNKSVDKSKNPKTNNIYEMNNKQLNGNLKRLINNYNDCKYSLFNNKVSEQIISELYEEVTKTKTYGDNCIKSILTSLGLSFENLTLVTNEDDSHIIKILYYTGETFNEDTFIRFADIFSSKLFNYTKISIYNKKFGFRSCTLCDSIGVSKNDFEIVINFTKRTIQALLEEKDYLLNMIYEGDKGYKQKIKNTRDEIKLVISEKKLRNQITDKCNI